MPKFEERSAYSISLQIEALIKKRNRIVKPVMKPEDIKSWYSISGKIKKLEKRMIERKQFEYLAK